MTGSSDSQPIRLCVIINPSFGLTLPYGGRWQYLAEQGFQCTGVAGPGPEHDVVGARGVATKIVPMERYPSPMRDLVSLVRLWWYLLWHRFDVIEVSTPKASFLGALAARLSGHSRVLYLVRGRAYEHMTGIKRRIMNACEWVTCHAARCVVPISRELGQVLVDEGLCPPGKITLVASGSSKGIDLHRYHRSQSVCEAGRLLRESFGIAAGDIVILAVGWLRREKGIDELVAAFQRLADEHPGVRLWLLGDVEPSDPLKQETMEAIQRHPRISHLPRRDDPAPVYAGADIAVCPSWREGFGNVPLEAGAMGLPVVASDIMGLREAVQRDVTGLLYPLADADALHACLARLVADAPLRARLGDAGRHRVISEFRQERIWQETADLYRRLVQRGGTGT